MDLILHIGSNKTASSNLQNFCRDNRRSLLKKGIYYPETGTSPIGAHHYLAAHLLNKKINHFAPTQPYDEFEKVFLAELKKNKVSSKNKRVLISSEMLFDFKRIDLSLLERFLGLFNNVKILVYLRRQDSYLPSFYNSKVRNGDKVGSLENFIDTYNLDYLENLQSWEKAVGERDLKARPFSRSHLKNQNIYEDFLDFCGLNVSLTLKDDFAFSQNELSDNKSLPQSLVSILRITNNNEIEISNRAGFISHLRDHFREDKYEGMLSQDTFSAIKEKYSASNRQLEKKYFETQFIDSFAFPEMYESTNKTPLSEMELIKALVNLWNNKSNIK